jgi:hypothetical protein
MDLISFRVSPLLREVAEVKIEQLDRHKQAYRHRYPDNKPTERVAILAKLSSLVENIKAFDPYLEGEKKLSAIERYVAQAREDESISETKLLVFDQQLERKIARHLKRLHASSLHAELLKEAMADDKATDEHESVDGEFEVFGDLDAEVICEDVKDKATTVREVNVDTIEHYLSSLMELGQDTDALQDLRDAVDWIGTCMIEQRLRAGKEELTWWILDLVDKGLISDKKKEALKCYLLSPMAMTELVSIINLKSVREWNWKNAEKGRLVRVAEMHTGKLYVSEDDDMIDILFLHGIATTWAVNLKRELRKYVDNANTVFSLGRRSGPGSTPPSPEVYTDTVNTADDARHETYMRDFFVHRLPSWEGDIPKTMRPKAVQARLIKTLATEVKLCEAFEEKAYTFVVEFHETCLETIPHSTVLTVLKYLGIPDVFLDFFTRFLTEKLDIGPGRLVTRAAGVPEHHGAMQLFFTEVIFFFLELAVYKSTDMCLYRIHNTCYFVGTANEVSQARKEVDNFGSVMNLSFNECPGDLHIGFLS